MRNLIIHKDLFIFFLFIITLLIYSFIFVNEISINWILSSTLSLLTFVYLFYFKDDSYKLIFILFLILYTFQTIPNSLFNYQLKNVYFANFITSIILIFSFSNKKKFISLLFLLIAILYNQYYAEQRVLLSATAIALVCQLLNKKITNLVFIIFPIIVIFLTISLGIFFFKDDRLFGLRDIYWFSVLIGDLNYYLSSEVLRSKLNAYNVVDLYQLYEIFKHNPHSMYIGSFIRFGFLGLLLSFIFWYLYYNLINKRIVNLSKFQKNLFISHILLYSIFSGKSFFSIDNHTISLFLITYLFSIFFGNKLSRN
jgi:hypothetical protein